MTKKYKTITVEKYNWSGSEILITDFQTKQEKVLIDTNLISEINKLNQEGYAVTAVKGREHYMTKEIEKEE